MIKNPSTEPDATEEITSDEHTEVTRSAPKHRFGVFVKKLLRTKKRRALAVILGVLIVLGILYAIPATRYAILGPIVKKDVSLTVIDSKTKQPVSNATVSLGGVSDQSDKDGIVHLKRVSVGQPGIKVEKQYYKTTNVAYTVPVIGEPAAPKLELVATGRQVLVKVTNKISGSGVSDVVISSGRTKATTNSDGKATIILPATNKMQSATLTKQGFNTAQVTLATDDVSKTNGASITPAGSIYFLSKATGKINVMKSNLDGTNPAVVVEGTGQEVDSETSLLSTRDWQYAALTATRAGNTPGLYVVDSNKNDFRMIDEGDATFSPTGWAGHIFTYTVYRNTPNYWDDKKIALKAYNAETGKLTTLDETIGFGKNQYDNSYEYTLGGYLLGNELVYAKTWNYGSNTPPDPNKTASLIAADVTTGTKKVVKTFPNNQIRNAIYEPESIYVRYENGSAFNVKPPTFYEYEDGELKTTTGIDDNTFNSYYITYLLSPTGKKTFWFEPRDGKNTLLIGDSNALNAKTVASLSEYKPYGWYGQNDEYVLLSKGGSELYIAAATDLSAPLKVTDYHKVATFAGYGSGYGGQ